jgi:hypothetical protein
MSDDYRSMFQMMLIFTPVLMILSYMAGTSHDVPKKPKDPLLGLKLRRKALSVCTAHASKTKGPSSLVSSKECDFCKKGS